LKPRAAELRIHGGTTMNVLKRRAKIRAEADRLSTQPEKYRAAMVAKRTRKTGLIGLFGHTYVTDKDNPDFMTIQYQFEIIRHMPPDRWVAQLFSFMDGRPTEVTVYAESFLLGDEVKLYAHHGEWLYASERNAEQKRDRRNVARMP
jgi:hypothetical protein